MKRLIITLFVVVGFVASAMAQPKSTNPNATTTMFDFFSDAPTQNVFFSFAQISDTHISLDDTKKIDALKNVVNEINSNGNIAFALLSGDITEYGDFASLTLVKDILSKLNCPYYVVPGNHDTKWAASGGVDFQRVFGDNKFRMLFNGYLFMGFNNAPALRQTNGHIAPEDIVWIERQMKNIGRKTPVFLFTHYPLKSGDVDNWFDLTDVVRKHNIQAVLCGHYHRNMVLDFDGIPGIASRPLVDNKSLVGYSVGQVTEDSIFFYDKTIGNKAVLWTSHSLAPKTYVEGDRTKFPRPDYSVNQQYKGVKSGWRKTFGYEINSSAACADQTAYFGDNSGAMHALAVKNGKELWIYKTANAIFSTPQIADDKLVFTSTDNKIYCLNRHTGQLLWKVATAAPLVSTPLISQGVVYAGGSDGKFRALNLASGSELWAFDKVEGFVQSKPAVYNGLIVFTAADNAVYALRASDGSLAWKYSVADNGSRVGYAAGSNARQSLVAPVAVSVVASNDKVFFSTPNHSLYALSAADGKLLWKDDSAKYIESLGVSTDNNTLFARSSDGLVFLVDTKAGKPEIIKTIKSCYTQDLNHTAIVPYDKYLLMATNDGMVVAVDPEAGSVAKCIKFDNVAVNTVAVADSRVIATTTNGVVVAIDGIIK